MRPSRRPIVIATRNSRLALAQSGAVRDVLQRLHPKVSVELLPVEQGDQLPDQLLHADDGKDLFTRAVEQHLLWERADVAVHSLKDMPTRETPGLVLAAITARADARDALIARGAGTLADLPSGAVVGTASPRRAAQVLAARPDLAIESLRGNIDTRLGAVLSEERFDATLLAMAGLLRGGLPDHTTKPVSIEQMVPSPGQGALAIQCRADDHVTVRRCLSLNNVTASTLCNAERELAAELGGGCHAPVGIYAEAIDGNQMRLRARVLSLDGRQRVDADETGEMKSSRHVVETVLARMNDQGAQAIVKAALADLGERPIAQVDSTGA